MKRRSPIVLRLVQARAELPALKDSPLGAAIVTVVPAQFESEQALIVDESPCVNTLPFMTQPTVPTTVIDEQLAAETKQQVDTNPSPCEARAPWRGCSSLITEQQARQNRASGQLRMRCEEELHAPRAAAT
ncbi:MAG TPA: hypothetical protein VER96_31730 [Polyangiaceae bacterium]|nr:hypothetical protein [Polyangiaceae bacterium]